MFSLHFFVQSIVIFISESVHKRALDLDSQACLHVHLMRCHLPQNVFFVQDMSATHFISHQQENMRWKKKASFFFIVPDWLNGRSVA